MFFKLVGEKQGLKLRAGPAEPPAHKVPPLVEDSNWAATGRPRAPPLTTQVPVTGDRAAAETL